jgi:tRNA pseudouridine55 synthase
MHGWITLDKPLNMSSAHAVDRVKKQLRKIKKDLKIGHAGTLDPLATGVLVLAVGEATKLINYAMDAPKVYAFTSSWGEERETDDREGAVVASSDRRPTKDQIEAILAAYIGDIMQAPPAYSAIKMEGRRAYDMARAGEAPQMQPRQGKA